MNTAWHNAGRVRRDFADMVEQLDADQWAADTLCAGWTPKHVLAHVVWFTELNVPRLLMTSARSRFNFDDGVAHAANKIAERTPEQLLADLRSRADKKTSVPGAPEDGIVIDTAIHMQDVRRPLGLDGTLDPDVVRVSLDFLFTHRNAKYVMDPELAQGLRLTAPDIGWSWGSGPEVIGDGEALLLALAGRPTLDELGGDGVEILRQRQLH